MKYIIHLISYFIYSNYFLGGSRILSFLRMITPGELPNSLILHKLKCRKKEVVLFINPSASYLERELYYSNVYELGTLSFIGRILNKGDVFVDVGANIGYISICAAACSLKGSGKIICIEPNIDTFGILQKNMDVMGVDNCQLYNIGVGECDKNMELINVKNGRGQSTLVKGIYSKDQVLSKSKVTIKTLDHVLMDVIPTVVKIDIEGYELNALKGAGNMLSSKENPIIILEHSAALNNSKDESVIDYLTKKYNYAPFLFSNTKRFKSKLVAMKVEPEHDNIVFIPQRLVRNFN
jgi:FkbM family methyltransferase